ncbi:PilZ domain-containing protein [Geminicoccus roseus]|uniref:PilZ domain-containing protein n=1 Tax=Geminicoccus roseus TaxID=404900 RepID=UPI0004247A6B|nr:PilZ domain-containing protein [Geminicoccus roseus]
MDHAETDGQALADLLPPLGERRYHRRYAAGLPARLEIDGAVRPVTILNLSLGGAGLAPALPATIGAAAEIGIDGLTPSKTLRARVVSVSRHQTHLLFDCTAEEQASLVEFLLSSGSEV